MKDPGSAHADAPQRVRVRVLVPLVFALALLLALFVGSTYRAFTSRRDEAIQQASEHSAALLRRATLDTIETLSALTSAVTTVRSSVQLTRDPMLV